MSARSRARLPPWAGTIRFRLALAYSVVVFGLTAALLAGIYWGVERSLSGAPVSRGAEVRELERTDAPGRSEVEVRVERVPLALFEAQVNERTLSRLRSFSLAALGALFVASLGLGWLLAGRALRPARRIAAAAREIQATDLSRRIALEGPRDELRHLADTFDAMLERVDRAVTHERRLVHDLSHELRNPLAVLRTNIEVALADPQAPRDELRRALVVAEGASERLSRLVGDLFAWARREAPDLRLERIDLAALVRQATDELQAAASARSVVLEAQVEGDYEATGDRLALHRALANLFDNAIRHAPPSSTVRTTLGHAPDPTDATLLWTLIRVSDHGPGIPPEQRELVFERLWSSGHAAPEAQGSGLGLAVVRQIAEAHGGSVHVDPTGEGGTTFSLWLPAAPDPR